MKKVCLKNLSSRVKGEYIVYLGNGTAHTFSSKRNANQFLSQTNQFLTQQLYELRILYSDVTKVYHEFWCYTLQDYSFKNSFSQIDKSFDFAIVHGSFLNGNYYVFNDFKFISSELKSVINDLNTIAKKRSSSFDLYRFDSFYRRLAVVESQISIYGYDKAYSLFKVPVHIENNFEYVPKLNVA